MGPADALGGAPAGRDDRARPTVGGAWTAADIDRVANAIIAILNREIQAGASPVAVFGGQLGALIQYAATAPPDAMPSEFVLVVTAAKLCLLSIVGGMRDAR